MQRVRARVSGKCFTELYFIEVFCGTGRLTATVRKAGIRDAFGIDHIIHPKLRAPALKLNLCTDEGLCLFYKCLEEEHLIWVHFAPPCGTSSRARNIKRRGRYCPPPLRSEREPDGMKAMPMQYRSRVKSANHLYLVTSRAVWILHLRGIFWSVENPWRSFMWNTSFWNKYTTNLDYYNLILDHCMFGGHRPKRTRISHCIPAFQHLGILCDQQHSHLPWGQSQGVWATSEETAYPLGLCHAMVQQFLQQMKSLDVILPPLSLKDVTTHDDVALARAFGGKQPRGKRIPPLVSEFKSIVELIGPKQDMPPDRIKQDWLIPPTLSTNAAFVSLPEGCRVVRSHFYKGELGRTDIADHQHFLCEQGITVIEGDQCNIDGNSNFRCIVGVPWSPEEFIAQASNHARHPHNLIEGVPSDIKACVEYRSEVTSESLAMDRTSTMRRWMSKLVECMDDEKSFKCDMSPHRSKILASKRLVLFRELLTEARHDDEGLVDNIKNGFDLVGDIPRSGVYKKRVKPAGITTDELRRSAKRTRRAIIQSTRGSDDPAIDLGVYQSTMDEMERGWLHGPYKESDLDGECTVTRRFGVRQGSKIRPIDNYTESLVNQTTSAGEAISLHSTDVIAATLSLWMSVMCKNDCNKHKLDVVGKSYDLHKAYKHLCISDDGLKDAYICVFNPMNKEAELFGQYVLPFGACASVHGFCRTSYGLWIVGIRLLKILWTVYFDDFIVFEECALSRHCEFVVGTFFKMLGWATSIDKENDFSYALKALGISIDLSDVKQLRVRFSNTEERRFEVTRDIQEILKTSKLGKSEGQRLRGRLLFAESQIHGRRSVQQMRVLSKHVHGFRSDQIDEETKDSLRFLHDKLVDGQPRYITPLATKIIHLYCDASYEPGSDTPAGFGCVLVDPDSGSRMFISEFIDRDDVTSWNFAKSKHPIYEFELIAILIGLRTLMSYLQHRAVVVFTDNEGALGSLITCRSDNPFGQYLIGLICGLEESAGAFLWYERVNTASNIADLPSRDISLCGGLGGRCRCDLSELLKHISFKA